MNALLGGQKHFKKRHSFGNCLISIEIFNNYHENMMKTESKQKPNCRSTRNENADTVSSERQLRRVTDWFSMLVQLFVERIMRLLSAIWIVSVACQCYFQCHSINHFLCDRSGAEPPPSKIDFGTHRFGNNDGVMPKLHVHKSDKSFESIWSILR